MSYLQLDDGVAGKWITDNLFIVSDFAIDGVDINDARLFRAQMFNIIKAKFKHKHNVTVFNEVDDKGITALTATSNFATLEIAGTKQILKNKSTLIFIGTVDYKLTSNDFIIQTFRYKDGIRESDIGSKKYKVTSIVKDLYEITVSADSEEEAIEKSRKYNISEWDHVEDYDSHLTEIVFIRGGRWGNLEAREIGGTND